MPKIDLKKSVIRRVGGQAPIRKKVNVFNPFNDDEGEYMPPPKATPRIRVYRFLKDGTVVEAATASDYHSAWTGKVTNPDGKVLEERRLYSETDARNFVNNYPED